MRHFLLLAAILLSFSSTVLSQTGTIEINQPPTPLSVEVGQTVTVNVTYSATEEMDIEAAIYQLNPNGSINWGPGNGGAWKNITFPASAGTTVTIDIKVPADLDPDLNYGFLFQLKHSSGTKAEDNDNTIDLLPSSSGGGPTMDIGNVTFSGSNTAGEDMIITVPYASNEIVYFKAQLYIKNTVNNGVNYDNYGIILDTFPASSTVPADLLLPIKLSTRGSSELGADSAYTILVEFYIEEQASAKGKGVSRASMRIDFEFISPSGPILPATAVPIKLVSFIGEKYNESAVRLKWQTALEINNDYFTLEKSSDGKSWEPFSKIQANGNTNILNEYSTIDRNPYSGANFYRLKQTDFDGSSSYSNAIKVNLDRFNIDLYPNPVIDRVIVSIPDKISDNTSFQLFDVSGKLVKSGKLETPQNDIDFTKLISGNYFINILENNEVIHRQKIIKK